MLNKELISKTELARELAVSKARVSQLVARGLPVRADGTVNRAEALRWIAKYTASSRGGWPRRGGAATSLAKRAGELLGETAPKWNLADPATRSFASGGKYAWHSLTRALIEILPPMKVKFESKIVLLAVIDNMLSRWFAEFGVDPPLPLDWSPWGARAEEAAQLFQEMWAFYDEAKSE
jgi:phage terminase Nu1 subunit (DNA packaging protein)